MRDTRQHSEYDADWGRSSVWRNSRQQWANAEICGAKHKILTFVIVQKRPAMKPMTLRRTQHEFWFPERSVGKCQPCIRIMGSSESVLRGSFAALIASINACLSWNNQSSPPLLLNIQYFPSEKWSRWNRPNRTGGCGHVVTTTKEAAILDCGHVVIDSANETTYWKPQSLAPRFDAFADEDNFYFFLVHVENKVGGSVKHKINLVWP